MLNQFVGVGRFKSLNKNILTIEIPRNYKNDFGEYDKDEIKIMIGKNLINNIEEYVSLGNILGVKGRIETREEKLVVVADKITFLPSGKEN
jgi:single-stranded DNA-binding protein